MYRFMLCFSWLFITPILFSLLTVSASERNDIRLKENLQSMIEDTARDSRFLSANNTQAHQLYPDGLAFAVFRKGKNVGEHLVSFSEVDGRLHVRSQMRLRVKLLFITGYKFDFESIGVWND
ncbi:MAG: hypothetical protein CMM25_00120, partial [Rhodospirillaceae bacterium]|nr:hypothetical protein [Rhodospirillaceae bacterium]